jgi:hypothetical protein
MDAPGQAQGGRRVVRRIVLTYTLEDDPSGAEHTMVVERGEAGAVVDGLVWSRRLMERLTYMGEGGQPVPQRSGRPDDGWSRRGRQAAGGQGGGGNGDGNGGGNTRNGGGDDSLAGGNGGDADAGQVSAMSTGVDECIWLHMESCSWMSLCDPG